MSVETECRQIAERIIELLKEERERRGLSKYEVAARSGLSEQTVGYIEKGMRSPGFETMLRLSRGVGADLAEMIRKASR